MVKYCHTFDQRRVAVNIVIKKLNSQGVHGNSSAVMNAYSVIEAGKEFTIICTANHYGRSFSLTGKKGTLHTDRENNTVHVQTVALGGGCGLLIDEEPVEGLSPLALRGVIIAEQSSEAQEIMITTQQTENPQSQPALFINGSMVDFPTCSDMYK